MKRTLKEKLQYNEARHTPFSIGYGLGVMLYSDYKKMDSRGKQVISDIIGRNKRLARSGDEMGKGFMCGVRDAANERKSKQKH